jgi:hypothetical protein
MGKDKKEELTLDQRIQNIKVQMEDVKTLFLKLQGALEILEELRGEKNEKRN